MDIIWTSKARITYYGILDYLDNNWTQKEIIQFQQRTQIIIDAIKKNPKIFPFSAKHKKIRKAFIDKNNSLFYISDDYTHKFFLLAFFDNRQNPGKIKEQIGG